MEIAGVSTAAVHIHTFLKLGICVMCEVIMLLLPLRSVGRVLCGFFESYPCSVALLVRKV